MKVWPKINPVPPATIASANAKVATTVLVVVVLNPPATRAATLAETAPAVPAGDAAALRTVVVSRAAGTARLAVCVNAVAASTPDSVTPRRASRPCKCFRAWASRLETVPSFSPNRQATSARGLLSMQQSTNTVRYFSASLWISSSSTTCTSRHARSAQGLVGAMARARPSWERRLAAARLMLKAIRDAAPYNQLASAGRFRIEAALLARMRKVA
ncbi:MAG TPA: hypothetical protein VG013_37230 [Gemmataceae bacterium]|nr:hypothetical protein [Gemmataceae bacterium]